MKMPFVRKVVVMITVMLLPTAVLSQETYRFERMWPTINQSWNFLIPNGIAFDMNGNLYVTDSKMHRIVKLTQDGFYITSWGGRGDGDFDIQHNP